MPYLRSLVAITLIASPAVAARQPSPVSAPIAHCTVTDGDTIRCGAERIRLLGIDAPEMPGHCRRGRRCVTGDPIASAASLRLGMGQGPLTITRIGRDRYGRTLALVRSGSSDLSCWQLRRQAAIYRPQWDEGGRVRARCPMQHREPPPPRR